MEKKWLSEKNKNLLKIGFLWNFISLILISLIKMKKQRYGIPLYIITNIPCGVIVYHYYKKPLDGFKKYEKWIFNFQGVLIAAFFIGMIVLFSIKEIDVKMDVGKKGVFLLEIILYFVALISYSLLIKKFKEYKNKIIIIFTGVAMLLVNATGVWFIEKELMFRSKREPLEYLNAVAHIEKDLKIYSFGFKIEDVWRVGREIIKIQNSKSEKNITPAFAVTPNELPERFLLLVEGEKNSDILKERTEIKEYHIIKEWEFYRNLRNNKIATVYEIKLKK